MRVVLNVAKGSWYHLGQKRLLDSIPDETTMLWTQQFPPGPTHEGVPYGFKVSAFYEAVEMGFQQAIWLDSSCVVCKPLPWKQIERDGYYLGLEGWTIGQWCNDACRELLAITDEELELPLMEGKIIGLDLTNDLAMAWLKEWKRAADIGAFNGSWENHRHDITCGAVIAHRLGMNLTEHPVTIGTSNPHPESYVLAAGM